MRVPIAIIRLVPLTRCSSCSGGCVACRWRRRRPRRTVGHLLGALLAVPAVGPQLAAERRRVAGRGAPRRSASSPSPARAAATARSSPTISAVLTSSSATSAARRPGGRGAGRELEAVDADRAAVDDDVVARSGGRARRAPRAGPTTCFHRSASCASVTDAGSTSTSGRPGERARRDQGHARDRRCPRRRLPAPARRRVPRAAARTPRPRRPRAGWCAASGRRPCRRRTARTSTSAARRLRRARVPEPRAAPSRSVAAIAVPVRGCAGSRWTSSASTPSSPSVARHLRGGGPPARRAEHEVHECSDRPPERDRGEQPVGERGPEVQRRRPRSASTSSWPRRRTGRVRYGDATEMTATMIATRTAGKLAESSPTRVTTSSCGSGSRSARPARR